MAQIYVCTDCHSIFAFDENNKNEPTGEPMPVDFWGKTGEFTHEKRRYIWNDYEDEFYKYQTEMGVTI